LVEVEAGALGREALQSAISEEVSMVEGGWLVVGGRERGEREVGRKI